MKSALLVIFNLIVAVTVFPAGTFSKFHITAFLSFPSILTVSSKLIFVVLSDLASISSVPSGIISVNFTFPASSPVFLVDIW